MALLRLWRLLLPAAAVLLLGAGACRSNPPGGGVQTPRPGDALTQDAFVAFEALPPGQEIVEISRPLRNGSDEPLEITKLRAMPGEGIPDAVQIVQVSTYSGAGLPVGPYVSFPPVTRESGRCVVAKVRPTRGVTLAPGENLPLLVWVRAIAPGEAAITGFRVSYEQGGTLFEQEVTDTGTVVRVDDEAKALKPSRDERACAHRVRLLPGAVRI